MNETIKIILEEISKASRFVLPFFSSHHPKCDQFDSDTIGLGRFRICKGCTLVSLSLLLTIMILIFPLFDYKIITFPYRVILLIAGGLMASSQLIRARILINNSIMYYNVFLTLQTFSHLAFARSYVINIWII